MESIASDRRRRHRGLALASLPIAATVVLAACSSSGSKTVASAGATTPPAAGGTTAPAASPGTSFGTANVAGLGTVVVDGSGKTVYVLTNAGQKNVTCDDASGCTKIWPDLPLPTGTSAATAGSGLQASLLGTMKEADGQTYATYNGWLMYEFSGDSASGQGHGEGINSFGGNWYALSAAGTPILPSSSTATTAASGGGYG
jgi:predicted lipoprotein with Yx(FWY)xxD motif